MSSSFSSCYILFIPPWVCWISLLKFKRINSCKSRNALSIPKRSPNFRGCFQVLSTPCTAIFPSNKGTLVSRKFRFFFKVRRFPRKLGEKYQTILFLPLFVSSKWKHPLPVNVFPYFPLPHESYNRYKKMLRMKI